MFTPFWPRDPGGPTAKPATNTRTRLQHERGRQALTVEVRGQAYRVCSKHCAEAMQKDPDKYSKRTALQDAQKAK